MPLIVPELEWHVCHNHVNTASPATRRVYCVHLHNINIPEVRQCRFQHQLTKLRCNQRHIQLGGAMHADNVHVNYHELEGSV